MGVSSAQLVLIHTQSKSAARQCSTRCRARPVRHPIDCSISSDGAQRSTRSVRDSEPNRWPTSRPPDRPCLLRRSAHHRSQSLVGDKDSKMKQSESSAHARIIIFTSVPVESTIGSNPIALQISRRSLNREFPQLSAYHGMLTRPTHALPSSPLDTSFATSFVSSSFNLSFSAPSSLSLAVKTPSALSIALR